MGHSMDIHMVLEKWHFHLRHLPSFLVKGMVLVRSVSALYYRCHIYELSPPFLTLPDEVLTCILFENTKGPRKSSHPPVVHQSHTWTGGHPTGLRYLSRDLLGENFQS